MNNIKASKSHQAFQLFRDTKYQDCQRVLKQIAQDFCGSYISPSIRNNILLAEFYKSQDRSSEKNLLNFMHYLQHQIPEDLRKAVNNHLISTSNPYCKGNIAGGAFISSPDYSTPEEVDKEETKTAKYPDSSRDFLIFKYNTAVLSLKTQNNNLCLFYLKDIFKQFSSIDDYFYIKSSFFLIDQLLNMKKPLQAEVVHRYLMKRSNQLINNATDRATIGVVFEPNDDSSQSSLPRKGKGTQGGENSNQTYNPQDQQQSNKFKFPLSLADQNCIEKIQQLNNYDTKIPIHQNSKQKDSNQQNQQLPKITFGDNQNIKIVQSHLRAARAFVMGEYEMKVKKNLQDCMSTIRLQASTQNGQYQHTPTAPKPKDFELPQSHFLFPSYYFNNMGLVTLKKKKVKIAILYFQRALDCISSNDNIKKQTRSQKSPFAHFSQEGNEKIVEISYNLAFAHEMNGELKQAYQIYKELIPYLGKQFKLWYRMGECCYFSALNSLLKLCDTIDPLLSGFTRTNLDTGPSNTHSKNFYNPPEYYGRMFIRVNPILQNLQSPQHDQMDFNKAKYFQNALLVLTSEMEQWNNEMLFLKNVENKLNRQYIFEDCESKSEDEEVHVQKLAMPNHYRKMFIQIHIILSHIALMKNDHVTCLNYLNSLENYSKFLSQKDLFIIVNYKAQAYCRQGQAIKAIGLLRQTTSNLERIDSKPKLIQNSLNQYTEWESLSQHAIAALNFISTQICNGKLNEAIETMDSQLQNRNISLINNQYIPLPFIILKIYLSLREGDNLSAARMLKNKRNIYTINLGTPIRDVSS